MAAIGQPFNHADLPQGPVRGQGTGHDPRDQRLQLLRASRGGNGTSHHVEVDVEVRIVDEQWRTEVKGHAQHAPAEHRRLPQSVLDVIPDFPEPSDRILGRGLSMLKLDQHANVQWGIR